MRRGVSRRAKRSRHDLDNRTFRASRTHMHQGRLAYSSVNAIAASDNLSVMRLVIRCSQHRGVRRLLSRFP